ncbi:TIR domain-containing protein [Pseudomonas syringae]|uniref:TIR domain-containing protein n=1 Tax=Pseudomonas syringae TaxID=317 RepID=UPI000EFDF4D3|nr:TIR domain-containing protein [Pseudomonas syringae]
MESKPNIFIASSSEALPVVEAVNIRLETIGRIKQWDNAFDLSSVTITKLIQTAQDSDFAVFVFHKDDQTIIRGEKYSSVRDNVLLELGIFIGTLGIEKCFILMPEARERDFRLPTDLAGVTTTYYGDMVDEVIDAVTTSCAKIKNSINKQLSVVTPTTPPADSQTVIENSLNLAHSQLWAIRMDADRATTEAARLNEDVRHFFFSKAKPATPIEVQAWELGAKETYLKEIKIKDPEVYYLDSDAIIPSLYGAGSIAVIVAAGVKIIGIDKWSHNNIYYMEGFRAVGPALSY